MLTMRSIEEIIRDLMLNDPEAPDLNAILNQIEFRKSSYDEYHPTTGPFPGFDDRFSKWINKAPTKEDQQVMIQMVPEILFLGIAEFISLYRAAFNEHIIQWLITQNSIEFSSSDYLDELNSAISSTWFCPITDSMHIADFYHVNRLGGRPYRPDWYSLSEFAEPDIVEAEINKEQIKYIVLLEDFVGTGEQMSEAVQFAASLPGGYPVLVVPLVVCPAALGEIDILLQTFQNNLQFKPVLTLAEAIFVRPNSQPDEPVFTKAMRTLCNNVRELVQCPHGVFGYRDTGALFVMYTNCPDNTLPLIHHSSDTWDPLFPRSSRI